MCVRMLVDTHEALKVAGAPLMEFTVQLASLQFGLHVLKVQL